MKNLVLIGLVIAVAGVFYLVGTPSGKERLRSREPSPRAQRARVPSELESVRNPEQAARRILENIRSRRKALMKMRERAGTQNAEMQAAARRLNAELDRIKAFVAEAKRAYAEQKSNPQIVVQGNSYSQEKFKEVFVQQKQRQKEIEQSLKSIVVGNARATDINEDRVEVQMAELARKERQILVLIDKIVIANDSEAITSFGRQVAAIGDEIAALPVPEFGDEVRFGENKSERVNRQFEALLDGEEE